MTPLWMWEEIAQAHWFHHIRLCDRVWCYCKINWPWMH
jgi:hypothetical protein